jgi:MarR family transcriptional regulator, transcriptional regulator for hemolysin
MEVSAPPLSANLCWLLSTAAHSLTTEMTRAMEGLGVSPRGFSVLTTALSGAYTQTELARMIGLDKTTMVVTLDELEAAGLAERRSAPADRRARVIAVTEAGEHRVREAEDIAARTNEDVLGVLDPDEREAFLAALMRLVGERLSEPVACAKPVRRRTPRP